MVVLNKCAVLAQFLQKKISIHSCNVSKYIPLLYLVVSGEVALSKVKSA